MAGGSFEDDVKAYYEKKSSYVALLDSVLDEREAKAAEHPSTGTKQAAMALHREHPNPDFSKTPNLLEKASADKDAGKLDVTRASEMVREMRAWVAKGKDKEAKEMLAKMDRELGAHALPKE